jgi:hypothetical protein
MAYVLTRPQIAAGVGLLAFLATSAAGMVMAVPALREAVHSATKPPVRTAKKAPRAPARQRPAAAPSEQAETMLRNAAFELGQAKRNLETETNRLAAVRRREGAAVRPALATPRILCPPAETVFIGAPTLGDAPGPIAWMDAGPIVPLRALPQARRLRGFEPVARTGFDFARRAAPPVAAAVPEPSTWASLIVGFAAIGATMRARRQSTVERPLRR